MSGKPLPLVLPPGIQSDVSRYMANASWWDGNLVRWGENGVMQPVGGWIQLYSYTGSTYPIREMFSWRDNNYAAYMALGTIDKASVKRVDTETDYDVTPTDLVFTPSTSVGFGSGQFGAGRFGLDSSNADAGAPGGSFDLAYWTFTSWGQDLLGVHSTDGRLWLWDPGTPSTPFTQVSGAPIGNRLCITTDERHAMVMGGKGNPRRVKWCSREDITTWAAAPDNSAGGFELDTRGAILAAVKVPQGLLVATDIDVHLIEYIGPPNYYSRRLITDETGIVSPKAITPLPNGAMFAGQHGFWRFNSGIVRMPCSVAADVFYKGSFTSPLSCFMGVNEAVQEVWFFYPGIGETEADRYVNYRFATEQQWWSKGKVRRTAWLNPIWSSRPLLSSSANKIYEHERGWTDDGSTRDIFAETGALEISEGDTKMAVDRLYHDVVFKDVSDPVGVTVPYEAEFLLAKAPQGPETIYGPVVLNKDKGYTTLRFKTRQVAMRVRQVIDQEWGFGKVRLRVKAVGK